jgi:hypothetical protein
MSLLTMSQKFRIVKLEHLGWGIGYRFLVDRSTLEYVLFCSEIGRFHFVPCLYNSQCMTIFSILLALRAAEASLPIWNIVGRVCNFRCSTKRPSFCSHHLFVYSAYILYNKQPLFLYTAFTDSVFLMEALCAICEVWTESFLYSRLVLVSNKL